ncbi:VOC family protein [Paenibacillus sp. GCM10023250]|uniref:VOC family protein n=1 Tax=Paenibacillus sp. GCM10023250 TaxID=3252648 RepID=UPI0036212081
MNNPIGFEGFIQIALVVKDIRKAAETWARFFNVPVPDIAEHPPARNPELTYRGEPAYYGLKFAVIQAGSFVIELHEPDEHDSTFREFLDKHGNGVHHLGFQVGDKRDAVIGELEKMGYAMRTVGYYPGSSWTIVDSEDDLGVNLNIKPKA